MALQPRVRFKKSSQHTRTRYLCLLQYFQLHCSICSTLGRFFIVLENKHFYFHGTRQVKSFYVALLRMFVRSEFLSAFILILGDFSKAKFIRDTSLIFSIVIGSYVTHYLTDVRKTNEIV